MTSAEFERAAKKILKLINVTATGLRYNFRTMTVQEWASWRREAEGNIDTWMGFTVTQDWNCFVKVCKTLLERINLKQWQSKRRLSTTFNSFDNEL